MRDGGRAKRGEYKKTSDLIRSFVLFPSLHDIFCFLSLPFFSTRRENFPRFAPSPPPPLSPPYPGICKRREIHAETNRKSKTPLFSFSFFWPPGG